MNVFPLAMLVLFGAAALFLLVAALAEADGSLRAANRFLWPIGWAWIAGSALLAGWAFTLL